MKQNDDRASGLKPMTSAPATSPLWLNFAICEHFLITCILLFHNFVKKVTSLVNFVDCQYIIASCGMMEDDVIRLKQVLDACPAVPAICLDVANGYSEHFVEFVKTVREKFPDHIIVVCV